MDISEKIVYISKIVLGPNQLMAVPFGGLVLVNRRIV